jgi:hypothetical protein
MKPIRYEHFTARTIAYDAVMTALLIGGQFVLSSVAGIEVVTVLLVCFSFVFGVLNGMLTAVAFSILRCAIGGFTVSAVVLYLIYYPLLALLFGLLGKLSNKHYEAPPLLFWIITDILLLGLVALGACIIGLNLIHISQKYKTGIYVFIYLLIGIASLSFVALNILWIFKNQKKVWCQRAVKLIFLTTLAAVCTICFTLLDDVIYPLIAGLSLSAARVYFYNSLIIMLLQTVCTIVTVSTLFYPLTTIFYKVKK